MKLRIISEVQFKPPTTGHRRSNASNARTTAQIGDTTQPESEEQQEEEKEIPAAGSPLELND